MPALSAAVEASLATSTVGVAPKGTLTSVTARAGAPRSATASAARALASACASPAALDKALEALLLREAAAEESGGQAELDGDDHSSFRGSTAAAEPGGSAEAAAEQVELSAEALDPEELDLEAISSALGALDSAEASVEAELRSLRAEAMRATTAALPALQQATSSVRSLRHSRLVRHTRSVSPAGDGRGRSHRRSPRQARHRVCSDGGARRRLGRRARRPRGEARRGGGAALSRREAARA